MIALQRIEPEVQPRRRVHEVERSRDATRRRFVRAQRRSYLAFFRVGAVVAIFVLPLMLYVMLTANLTSLNYALTRAQAQKTELLAQTMRQDDRIAKLESRERLTALAARLNMHDPRIYAVVTLPAPRREPPPARGVALLGQWLDLAASGSER